MGMGMSFDPEGAIINSISDYSQEDALKLGIRICRAIIDAVGSEGFHGGIRPDNIGVSTGLNIILGSPGASELGRSTPIAIEYMAPELFWSGLGDQRTDLYSVGLILYAALNGGRPPFLPSSGEITPDDRARAIQKRMKGERIPDIEEADGAFVSVVLKSLEFNSAERWESIDAFLEALNSCIKGSPPESDEEKELRSFQAFGKPRSQLNSVELMMLEIMETSPVLRKRTRKPEKNVSAHTDSAVMEKAPVPEAESGSESAQYEPPPDAEFNSESTQVESSPDDEPGSASAQVESSPDDESDSESAQVESSPDDESDSESTQVEPSPDDESDSEPDKGAFGEVEKSNSSENTDVDKLVVEISNTVQRSVLNEAEIPYSERVELIGDLFGTKIETGSANQLPLPKIKGPKAVSSTSETPPATAPGVLKASKDAPQQEKKSGDNAPSADDNAPKSPPATGGRKLPNYKPPDVRKKNTRLKILLAVCLIAALIILAFILNRVLGGNLNSVEASSSPGASASATADSTGSASPSTSTPATPSVLVSESPEHSGSSDTQQSGSANPSATGANPGYAPGVVPSPSGAVTPVPTGSGGQGGTPVPTTTPVPTPRPTTPQTTAPTPTTAPAPRPTSVVTPTGTYELNISNSTWTQAKEAAAERGGHLLTISSQEEFDEVIKLLEGTNIRYLWLGAERDKNGNWVWENGELIDFFAWDNNEPSGTDLDGSQENYLMLWKVSTGGASGNWAYNDIRNDPVSFRPDTYTGKIAYIIEF